MPLIHLSDADGGRSLRDPTRTAGIRRRGRGRVNARVYNLNKVLRETLQEQDAIGLQANQNTSASQMPWLEPSSGKLARAEDMINSLVGAILEGDSSWLGDLIVEAVAKGIVQAAEELRLDLSRVPHADLAAFHAIAGAVEIKGISGETKRQVLRGIVLALTAKQSPAQLMRNVRAVLEKTTRHRLLLLVSTAVVRALNAGKLRAYREVGIKKIGVIPEWVPARRVDSYKVRDAEMVNVLTAGDDAVCDECDDIATFGPYDIDEAADLIPAHPNCFLPGALVEGEVIAASKSWYSGDAIEVVTRGGKRLALTVKHPVMTVSGFVAAKYLRKGNKLITKSMQIGALDLVPGRANDDQDYSPTLIEQIYETLAPRGCYRFAPVADDFHGDAAAIKGEVDIVFSDGRLLRYFQAALSKRSGNLVLPLTDVQKFLLSSFSSSDDGGEAVLATTTGLPGGTNLAGSMIRTALQSRPLQTLRFGLSPDWDTPLDKPSHEGAAATTDFLRNLFRRATTLIEADEIVDLRFFHYEGHVYDLQTTSGYLIANGVYTSNCRCAFTPADDLRFAATEEREERLQEEESDRRRERRRRRDEEDDE